MDATDHPLVRDHCPAIRGVLARVGEKWTILVVMMLRERPRRFNDIRREVDGISQQMLTRTLKGLERDGMITRTVHPTVPPQVEYALTALGRSLGEPVQALGAWALTHTAQIEAARRRYDEVRAPTRPVSGASGRSGRGAGRAAAAALEPHLAVKASG